MTPPTIVDGRIVDVFFAILAVLALEVLSLIFVWYRIGKLRDLLRGAQGVQLAAEIQELRQVVSQQGQRITRIEDERTSWRGESIEVNQQLLRAMDSLRMEWRTQLDGIAARVAAEVRALIDADVRRLVREEFYRARGAGNGNTEGV